MERLLNFFSRHPWWVLLGILLVSLAAATQLRHVKLQISADELLVMDDPERAFFEQVRERFGDDQVVLLVLRDDHLLAHDKLEALKAVIERIEALPFVERVDSLFTVPHLRSVDGYLKTDPFLERLPVTEQEAGQLIQDALASPFVDRVLLSRDGRTMAVAVVLAEGPEAVDDYRLIETIDGLTKPLEAHYERHFSIGFPYVRAEIADKLAKEQGDLFPLAVAALLIALLILLRKVVDILLPVMTAGISILWTLGLMGVTGIPLNVVTSIVPLLLIIVGSTEDIHLLAEFRRGQKEGMDTARALKHMAAKMGRIVLLTFITTYAGFLSIGISGIEVLWQFSIVASTGLLLNFAITISLIPALLRLTGDWRLGAKLRPESSTGYSRAEAYWNLLHTNRLLVLSVLAVATLVAAYGMPKTRLNHNAIDNLASDSQVRGEVAYINDQLAGMESFSVVLDSGIEDTFLKVRYLDELVKIQEYLAELGLSRSSTSFADYLAMLNGVFQELDSPYMPANDDEVYELMIFLDYDHVSAYVSKDYASARILVRHNVTSTRELQRFITALDDFLAKEIDPGLNPRITGDSVLTLSATRSLVDGQLQSVLLLFAFVILVVSLLFTDIKVGLIAALPNALPVVVLFGFMGYADIPLNIVTTMAAAIAIGLAVDDTMHFMLRYNQELKIWKSQSRAMYVTIHHEALPVIATSVALTAGFLVFAFSDFEPVAQFGMLSAVVIVSALIADFIVTPLLMSSLRLVTFWDLLSSHLRQQVIPKSPLFRNMRPWQIRRFVLSSMVLEFAPGDSVFRRHDASDELYLVMKGVVEVSVSKPGAEGGRMVIDQFGSGEVFGDVAFLAKVPRHADAVALVPTSILVLNRDALNNTTMLHPLLGSRLCLNLAADISRRWVRLIERTQEAEEKKDDSTAEPDEQHKELVLPRDND